MADDQRLSEEEATLVFRRAAELEPTFPTAGRDRGGFDGATLERIGVEAGLSPAAVRQALAELRAGRLEPVQPGSRGLGPAELVIQRRVGLPAATVGQQMEGFLRKQQFRICRRRGDLTTWEVNRSLVANIARGIDLVDRMRLTKVETVELHVHEDGAFADVRVVLGMAKARTNARIGSIAGAALGVSGVVAAGVGLVAGVPEVGLLLPATSAGAAGAHFGARSSYAKTVKRAVDAVELALDELEHRARHEGRAASN